MHAVEIRILRPFSRAFSQTALPWAPRWILRKHLRQAAGESLRSSTVVRVGLFAI